MLGGLLASKLATPLLGAAAIALGVGLVVQTARIEGVLWIDGFKDEVARLDAEINDPETGWRKQKADAEANRDVWKGSADNCSTKTKELEAKSIEDTRVANERLANAWREYDRANRRAGAAEALAAQLRTSGLSQCEQVLEFQRRVTQ